MRKFIVLLSLMTMFCMAGVVYAGQVTANFEISADIPSMATVTAEPLNFGNYTGGELTSQSGITVTADQDLPYFISLSPGNSGNCNLREMWLGGYESNPHLLYNLYTTSAYTSIWGDGLCGGSEMPMGLGTGMPQSYTVYGKINSGQDEIMYQNGHYTDLITVTVSY